jgi:hypothetical protein
VRFWAALTAGHSASSSTDSKVFRRFIAGRQSWRRINQKSRLACAAHPELPKSGQGHAQGFSGINEEAAGGVKDEAAPRRTAAHNMQKSGSRYADCRSSSASINKIN